MFGPKLRVNSHYYGLIGHVGRLIGIAIQPQQEQTGLCGTSHVGMIRSKSALASQERREPLHRQEIVDRWPSSLEVDLPFGSRQSRRLEAG
jgi:hypothetical protein